MVAGSSNLVGRVAEILVRKHEHGVSQRRESCALGVIDNDIRVQLAGLREVLTVAKKSRRAASARRLSSPAASAVAVHSDGLRLVWPPWRPPRSAASSGWDSG